MMSINYILAFFVPTSPTQPCLFSSKSSKLGGVLSCVAPVGKITNPGCGPGFVMYSAEPYAKDEGQYGNLLLSFPSTKTLHQAVAQEAP
jgi:hypothetical protein